MKVEAIQHGAADARTVSAHSFWRTATKSVFRAGVSTWARIHRGDNEGGGWHHGFLVNPRDVNFTGFHRCAETLDHRPRKLWEFIEEENPAVGESDLSGLNGVSASHQRRKTDAVMRSSEGAKRA